MSTIFLAIFSWEMFPYIALKNRPKIYGIGTSVLTSDPFSVMAIETVFSYVSDRCLAFGHGQSLEAWPYEKVGNYHVLPADWPRKDGQHHNLTIV